MQAGKLKSERKASSAARAAARPAARKRRKLDRIRARENQRLTAILIEDGRKAWASPSHIAAVSAAYILQCAARRAEKADEKAALKAAKKAAWEAAQ